MKAAAERALRGRPTLRLVTPAVALDWPACRVDAACRQTSASELDAASDADGEETRLGLHAELAALGDTLLVRLVLFDVRSGAPRQTAQEVVHRAGPEASDRAFQTALALLLPPPAAPKRRAWYAEPWFWGGAAVVLGVGSVAVWALTRDSSRPPDAIIVPP